MFQAVKTTLKKQRPLGVLVGGLLLATALTTVAGVWHHKHELSHQTNVAQAEKAKQPSKTSATNSTEASASTVLGDTAPSDKKSSPQTSTKTTTQSPSPGSTPSASTSATSDAQQNTGMVNAFLAVNDSPKGTVSIPANSNHCDVLRQALNNGQISSLDIRYSAQYGTYAVYVIDGIGDAAAVWWTYKVNGQSPPYGCSQQPVRNGDSVNWQYIKR